MKIKLGNIHSVTLYIDEQLLANILVEEYQNQYNFIGTPNDIINEFESNINYFLCDYLGYCDLTPYGEKEVFELIYNNLLECIKTIIDEKYNSI